MESRIRSWVFPKLPHRPYYAFLELLLSFTYPISILLGAHVILDQILTKNTEHGTPHAEHLPLLEL